MYNRSKDGKYLVFCDLVPSVSAFDSDIDENGPTLGQFLNVEFAEAMDAAVRKGKPPHVNRLQPNGPFC